MTSLDQRPWFRALAAFLFVAGALSWADSVLPQPTFTQGVGLLASGQLDQADAVFQKVAENDPDKVDATLGQAQIAVTKQRLDDADRIVSEVLKHRNNLPEAHNMKGVILLLQKHPQEARREFLRAAELRSGYVTPRLYLAVLARQSGDYAGAVAEYKALTKVAPHLPTGYLGQAESLMLLRKQADALQVLEGWKTADPKNLLPYRVLADIDLADHAPSKAIRELQAALAKSPGDSRILTALGTAYAAMGDTQSAKAQFEAALAANTRNADAALRFGEVEAGEGQTDRALAHFRSALAADPDNIVARNNIAWLLANQGKHLDEALRLAESATKSDPKYVDGQDTLGWVRYQRKEYAQAISAFKEARALAPSRSDVAAHLNLANARMNETREAFGRLLKLLWLAAVIVAVSSAVTVWYISKERRAASNSQGIA